MIDPAIRDTLIVGGGPAGLAPLLAAGALGQLPALLAGGLAIVEQGPTLGAGRLGAYDLVTENPARAYLSSLAGQTDARLVALRRHPAALRLEAAGDASVPLAWAAALQTAIGSTLAEMVTAGGGAVFTGHQALGATRLSCGAWSARVRRVADGAEFSLRARRLVLATGGHQPAARLLSERVAGLALLPRFSDRLIQSDALLGATELPPRLAGAHRPLVVLIGAGPSARMIATWLRDRGCAVVQLHRGRMPTGPAPVGFRVQDIDEDGEAARQSLEAAALIVAAMGYRPRGLPLCDGRGQEIRLLAERPGQPLIDRNCRVLDARSRVVPDVFGLGLAAGFNGAGEPGAQRRSESLPVWQGAAGRMLAQALLADHARHARPPPLVPTHALAAEPALGAYAVL